MVPVLTILALIYESYLITAYPSYKIGSLEETIINPSFPGHEIPVFVYYPLDTNSSTTLPTIIFAHGFECDASWYPWIYKDMVPLGYIVTYINSFFPGDLNGTQFAIDQRYTLQWLTTIVNNNKSSPLYQRIDITKSMAAGHSEGGATTISSNGDPYVNQVFDGKYQFNSLFTMAPCGQFDDVASAQNVNIPIFVFTGTMDCACPHQVAHNLFRNIPETVCKYYADVTNATHCQWESESAIELACAEGERFLCKEEHPHNNVTITSREQLSIASQYMQLFVNATLIHGNNKNDTEKIRNQLNIDKNKGVMTEIIISKTC